MSSKRLIQNVYLVGRFPKVKEYDRTTSWEMGEECREFLDKLPEILRQYKDRQSLIRAVSGQQKESEKFYYKFFDEWEYLWRKFPELEIEASHYAKVADGIAWKVWSLGRSTPIRILGEEISQFQPNHNEAKESGVSEIVSSMYYGVICLFYRMFLSPNARIYGKYCFRWLDSVPKNHNQNFEYEDLFWNNPQIEIEHDIMEAEGEFDEVGLSSRLRNKLMCGCDR